MAVMVQGQVLRVGIVGCGKIADGHAEVLKYMPGAKLVAVCDREIILAEQLAVRFGARCRAQHNASGNPTLR